MKKIYVLVLTLLATQSINAQTEQTFKPSKGNFSTELNINPIKGNLSLNNSLNQIKGRYFVKDDLALRLGFGIDLVDSTINTGDPYSKLNSNTNNTYVEGNRKSTGLDFTIGIEKHFKGTDRLSPYIGFDFSIGIKNAKQHQLSNTEELTVDNGWIELGAVQYNNGYYYYSSSIVPKSYTRVGLSAAVGFDYYIAKNLFIGYEFNLGYRHTSFKEPTIEYKITPANPLQSLYKDNTVNSFQTSLMNGIRFGFTF